MHSSAALGALNDFKSSLRATAGAKKRAETSAHADRAGPCDILGAAGTPCVAAHSLARSLFGSYAGPLYAIKRASDSAVRNVSVLPAGNVADAAEQDRFCAGTHCTVTRIFDQSPQGNHLDRAPGGGPSRAKPASRSLRRVLLTPQFKAGSLYRRGERTFKRAACGL